ncbi:MAG: DUF4296 domain-containing protein [Candidatus Egerieousia sp.]
MMKSLIKAIFVTAAIVIFGACTHVAGPAINDKDMSRIISEVYLVDQWAKTDNAVNMRADSTLIYNAIFVKYGYTFEQYSSSMAYYVRHWKKYLKVLNDAHKLLLDGAERANELFSLESYRLKPVVCTPRKSDKSLYGQWWKVAPGPFKNQSASSSDYRIPYKSSIKNLVGTEGDKASKNIEVHVNTPEQGYDDGEWKLSVNADEEVINMQPDNKKKAVIEKKPALKGKEVDDPSKASETIKKK